MAEFRIKNLMIDVTARDIVDRIGGLCRFPTRFCNGFLSPCIYPTKWHCQFGTIDCLISDGCGPNYSGCYGGTDIWLLDTKTLVINPEDLVKVKADFGELVKAIEVRAAEVKTDMRPRNLEQVQMLQEQLKLALDELDQIKKELGGK